MLAPASGDSTRLDALVAEVGIKMVDVTVTTRSCDRLPRVCFWEPYWLALVSVLFGPDLPCTTPPTKQKKTAKPKHREIETSSNDHTGEAGGTFCEPPEFLFNPHSGTWHCDRHEGA